MGSPGPPPLLPSCTPKASTVCFDFDVARSDRRRELLLYKCTVVVETPPHPTYLRFPIWRTWSMCRFSVISGAPPAVSKISIIIVELCGTRAVRMKELE